MPTRLEHPQFPAPTWTDNGIATWGPDDGPAWVVASREPVPVYVHENRLASADHARQLASYLERAAAWLDWPDDLKVTSAMLGSRERYAIHHPDTGKIVGHVSAVSAAEGNWRADTTQDGEPIHAFVSTIKAGAKFVLRRFTTMD